MTTDPAPGAGPVAPRPSVVVVGAGNIGSFAIGLLARLPWLGRLIIVDPDVYEARNVWGQDVSPGDCWGCATSARCASWRARRWLRALLCAGDVAAARAVLGPLLGLRGAEVADDRFAVRLLWADYQLARAQRGAGLPVVDPLTGRPVGELAPTTTPPALSEQRLRAAEQSYARAGDEGRRLDARLECDWRARAIADRLALVETTRRQVAAHRARRVRGLARRVASA